MKEKLSVLLDDHNILIELLFVLVLLLIRIILISDGGKGINLIAIILIGILAIMDSIAIDITIAKRFNEKLVKMIHHTITIPLAGAIYLFAVIPAASMEKGITPAESASVIILAIYIVARTFRGIYRHVNNEDDQDCISI